MTRSRSPKKQADEKAFPVRVRISVPELGLGTKYDEMFQWLQTRTNGKFAFHSDSLPGIDAMAIFVEDPIVAVEVVDKFKLRLVFNELY